ncbi:MAG: Long-chain-fatty-acid--CoA ligase @ Long-chain fatty-acid-CoA ligase, Mycobacterial subgroup FadD35, partial [uncultured Pseudonocardia sp.]
VHRHPRRPVLRVRPLGRAPARRHDRRRLRPHRRRPPRPRGAGGGADRPPLDLRAAARGGRRRRARTARRRCREGRPARDLVAQRRGVDARPVRHGQARRHPGQHQPGLPHPRAGVRARPGRHLRAGRGDRLQDLRLRRDDRGGPAELPGPAPRRAHRHPRLGGAGGPRPHRRPRRAGPPPGRAEPGRPDQHPVHVGHDGLPQGRHPEPPQHPQQRLQRRAALRLHPRGPRLHPRALLPLLRHGDGQPRVHLPRRHDGDPRAGLRPEGHAARGRGRAVHVPLRGADDVHRRAQRPRFRVLRPVEPAHRDHGRLAVPGRGHEAGRRADGDGWGHHLLRHDRDQSRVHPDPRGRHAGPARLHRGAGAPAHRGEGRRPGDRADAAPRAARRAVHPGLLGDAGLLERAGQDRGGHRRRAVDAHRRHRGHGRRGLPQHHRPDQGHGHPGRGERVPARDRGVPLHPPRRRRRAGGRRAGRQVRGGAVRLGEGARGRARADGGGAAGVRRRQARALQDPPLRAGGRRVPDDRHRQGAQGGDAGAQRGAARPRRGRGCAQRV